MIKLELIGNFKCNWDTTFRIPSNASQFYLEFTTTSIYHVLINFTLLIVKLNVNSQMNSIKIAYLLQAHVNVQLLKKLLMTV